jgi:GNAT superfamily N-acetyltransferase
MLTVFDATTPAQLDQVRQLIRSFVAWHRERHVEDLALIDEYFDAAAFEAELASLPGEYAQPRGALLLATHEDRAAGCVAIKELDARCCEMKRMFVYPQLQRLGVGLALGQRIVERAREAGYEFMRLDTSFRQTEAIGLYRRLGFSMIEPYYDVSQSQRDWLVFMELKLAR